jgi:hypothetical protein
VKLAKVAQLAAVHMTVFRRQAVVQFAQLIARPGMIEKVNEKVDLPGAGVAEIGLADHAAGPLSAEH